MAFSESAAPLRPRRLKSWSLRRDQVKAEASHCRRRAWSRATLGDNGFMFLSYRHVGLGLLETGRLPTSHVATASEIERCRLACDKRPCGLL